MELQIRGNQLITTFGPGSIVDFPNLSIMPSSVLFWSRKNSQKIDEPRLSRILTVKTFYSPPHAFAPIPVCTNDIPFQFFPTFVVCPSCQRIGHLKYLSRSINQYRRGLKCRSCGSNLYPARFIMACENGHIDDFPWSYWVHKGKKECPGLKLKLYSRGISSGLNDLVVKCLDCNEYRSMAGALAPDTLADLTCTGRKPWLEEDIVELRPWFEIDEELKSILNEIEEEENEEEGKENRKICTLIPRALQRGASNVYFSLLESALSLPEKVSALLSLIRTNAALSNPVIKNWIDSGNEHAVRELIVGLKDTIPELEEYSLEQIYEVVKEIHGDKETIENYQSPKELKDAVRIQEWDVLTSWEDIDCTTQKPPVEFTKETSRASKDLVDYIDQITRVKRLREVRVLYGFKRIKPEIELRDEEEVYVDFRNETEYKWLPAVEVKGEGIFVRLNANRIQKWKSFYQTCNKFKILCKFHKDQYRISDIFTPFTISPEFLLTHSLAHCLIRQLSLNCGYSSSSLRERIYSLGENKVGLLIYTSSSDSEGSLGGLVRQGQVNEFKNTLFQALYDASWCSSDPLCNEPSTHAISKLNIAACHTCLLISETSCENRNRHLDRRTLVGTVDNPNLGYFMGLI